jgi:hypothetical protein
MTGMERIARDASALPLAAHDTTVTWCDERGNWHTAFVDTLTGIPAATLATAAAARDGMLVTMETETRMERVR